MSTLKNISLTLLLLFFGLSTSCNKPEDNNRIENFQRYRTDMSFHSNTLKTDILYSVFFPKNYNTDTQKKYPVVYLLHGLGDDHKSWNDQWLRISTVIENMEEDGIDEMIYIMPQGFRSYYVNAYNGSLNYMNMFIDELVPHVDKAFRTIADREHRAVVGYSMGGFGAMILPTKHPEVFSVSVPLSMSFRTDEQYMTEPVSGWNDQWGKIFGGVGLSGEARLTDYYKQHCPFYIFTSETSGQNVKYFLDCGDDEEQLEIANDRLHVQLRENDIPHEYRVRDGGHTSSYWRSAMPEVLKYIQSCFKNIDYPTEPVFSLPSNFSATKSTITIDNKQVKIYLPQSYSSGNMYPLVLLFEDDDKCKSDNVMKILNKIQEEKPFIMAAITDRTDYVSILNQLRNTYNLTENKPLAIAYGEAENIYNSTLTNSPVSSLFLIDAYCGNLISQPEDKSVFYFITITDNGSNYKSANTLYEYCHALKFLFQYRVFNGNDSENSVNYILNDIKNSIKLNVK